MIMETNVTGNASQCFRIHHDDKNYWNMDWPVLFINPSVLPNTILWYIYLQNSVQCRLPHCKYVRCFVWLPADWPFCALLVILCCIENFKYWFCSSTCISQTYCTIRMLLWCLLKSIIFTCLSECSQGSAFSQPDHRFYFVCIVTLVVGRILELYKMKMKLGVAQNHIYRNVFCILVLF